MSRKITSLNIDGFRGLASLALKKVSDVNLIVGKNNGGKTTLLEASDYCSLRILVPRCLSY